jgi:hypothetical protein
MRAVLIRLFILFVACSANATLVTISSDLTAWGTSATATAGTDYYIESEAGLDELVFSNIVREMTYEATTFSAQNVGDVLSFDLSLTPSYSFAATGGLFWYEDGDNVGRDYLAIRYSYTGIDETNELYFEANVGGTNTNITLLQDFTYDGALNVDVTMTYSDTLGWVLSGQITSESEVLWDSNSSGIVAIASSVLTEDNEIFFGASDYTQQGTGDYSRLSGSFGVVPEPAVLALSLGLCVGGIVFFRRRGLVSSGC